MYSRHKYWGHSDEQVWWGPCPHGACISVGKIGNWFFFLFVRNAIGEQKICKIENNVDGVGTADLGRLVRESFWEGHN